MDVWERHDSDVGIRGRPRVGGLVPWGNMTARWQHTTCATGEPRVLRRINAPRRSDCARKSPLTSRRPAAGRWCSHQALYK